jgi:hypothetical protein
MADDLDAGFAPPPFNTTTAVVALRRQLRDCKLNERQGGEWYELAGRRVVEVAVAPSAPKVIAARLAKRPALTPEWTTHTLQSAADVRRFQDLVKQQLARWTTDD